MPGGAPLGQLALVHIELDEQAVGIHRDAVALPDQGDGAPHGRLRRHMPHHQAIGAPGEAAIGDQGHLLAEALAHDRGGGGKHLAHPGSSHRPLIADHHHITRVDLVGQNRLQTALLTFKHPRRACEHGRFHPADLGHATLAGQVALQDGQVALGVEGVVQRPDHVLPRGWLGGHSGQHLAQTAIFNGAAVAMEKASFQQEFHHLRNPADAVQVGGDVAAAGFEIANHGNPLADRFKIINRQRHASRARDRQ